MRRIVSAAALGLVFVLALAGCGPKEGDVLDKRWKPDLSYWAVACSTINGRTSCGPHWFYVPAEYILVLETPDGDIKEKNVKRKVYYKINVGDHYKED
jgi:hypothetical protein